MANGSRRLIVAALGVLLLAAQAVVASRPPVASAGTRGIADARGEMVLSELARTPQLPIGRYRAVHAPKQPPAVRAESSSGAPSTAVRPRTGSAQVPSPSPSKSFAGVGDDGRTIPPDTNGAVGPTQVLTALNSQVRVQSKSGVTSSTMSLATFWSSLGVSEPFDPRTRYDPYAGRFIMTSAAGGPGEPSSILLAVSKTSSAAGGWHQWRISVDSSGAYWADHPTLGFNKSWIVVQANIVSGAETFAYSSIYAFGRSSLYAGGLGSYTVFQDSMGSTQFPVSTYSSSLATMYLVENFSGDLGGSGSLRIGTITGSVGSEVYTGGAKYVTVTAPWADSPPGGADLGSQAGTSNKVNLGDSRIQSAVWRNGTIWAAHTVFLPSNAPSRGAVQWWQVDMRGEVIQRGRIDDPASGTSFAYPGIAVNKNNDVLLGYSRFSPTAYVSADYALRAGSDALSTIRGNTIMKAGEAPYYKTQGTGQNRWGDYSGAAVDPSDDTSLWVLQQYAWSSNRWATWWGQVTPPAPSGSPLMQVTPSPLTFASQLINTTSGVKQVRIKNDGAAPLTVNSATIGGANASEFSKTADPCPGQQLWPGMRCLVDVTFRPAAVGTRSATLTVVSTAIGSPHTIQLGGTGYTDNVAPVSSFRTQNGAISLGFPGAVFGQSTDDITGVASVLVRFESQYWTENWRPATLTCNTGNLSCTWSASNPIVPGTYTVRARAKDGLGNEESPGPVIVITVV